MQKEKHNMRILFFGNNWVGWKITEWLKGQGEEIVGLVIHPLSRRKYGEEIINTIGLTKSHIFDGSRLREPGFIKVIRALEPKMGISACFGYLLRKEMLDLMPKGCLNIHPGFLPYGRGAFPNVWSIVEGTPTGVTLHYMDRDVDAGDIVAQKEILVEHVDTGKTLYHKLEHACVDLFEETWPLIKSGHAPRVPQKNHLKTCHKLKDVERIDEIDLDQTYKAKELINLIRARTFPPYPGAYFRYKGRKIYLRLQLLYEDQLRESFNENLH